MALLMRHNGTKKSGWTDGMHPGPWLDVVHRQGGAGITPKPVGMNITRRPPQGLGPTQSVGFSPNSNPNFNKQQGETRKGKKNIHPEVRALAGKTSAEEEEEKREKTRDMQRFHRTRKRRTVECVRVT
eukprot:scaffold1548_cov50-Phaeocystis_antarctica.AAC.10